MDSEQLSGNLLMHNADAQENEAAAAVIKSFKDLIKTSVESYLQEKKSQGNSNAMGILDNYEQTLIDTMKEKEKGIDKTRYAMWVRMINNRDVKGLRKFTMSDDNANVLEEEIDEAGNTVLNMLVLMGTKESNDLLRDIIPRVSEQMIEKRDVTGSSAVHAAANLGNMEALELFKAKNIRLLSLLMPTLNMLPIHSAASWNHPEVVQYLLPLTDQDSLRQTSHTLLLHLFVSNMFGLAIKILNMYPHLARVDVNPLLGYLLDMLAGKTLAYKSGRTFDLLRNLIYDAIPVGEDGIPDKPNIDSTPETSEQHHFTKVIRRISLAIDTFRQRLNTLMWRILICRVPYLKSMHDEKKQHLSTVTLVRCMLSGETWTYSTAAHYLKEPVLKAARLGVHEFVDQVLKVSANSVMSKDKEGHNIFSLAVLHRKENVFNLIHHQFPSVKTYSNFIRDKNGDNILHLAGRVLDPIKKVGSATNMQRELQWFVGVKNLFHRSLQEMVNNEGLTPQELFTREHADSVKNCEKWMRETATSCSVVAALIITIVFAAAFTVPGGTEDGVPIYLKNSYFKIFAISIAVSLFASVTSAQMFLGMLTWSYKEDDFRKELPQKLIIGMVTLFVSTISMMVAFGAAFCILYQPLTWVFVLIIVLGILPVTLFVWMQFPVLFDVIQCTYGSNFLSPK